MQSLYPSEVLAFNNRAKGLAAQGFILQILSFFNTCKLFSCVTPRVVYHQTDVPPIAIKAAGWKFYLFYACWDALGVVVIYFT